MHNLKALPVQDLPAQLHVHFTGDLLGTAGVVTPPEYHFITMVALAQLDQSKCYVILDLEEVDLESFPQVVALQDQGQSIMVCSGDEFPEMLGYGGIGSVQSPHGVMLTMHLGGSSMNSASSVFIVPEELLAE